MGEKLQDHLAYPPRGLRAPRAAAYLGMATSTFLQLVEEGLLPKPARIKGIVVWDRFDLDAAFDNLKEAQEGQGREGDHGRKNSFDRLLGIDKPKP